MQTFRIFVLVLSLAVGAVLAQDQPAGIVRAGGVSLIRSVGKIQTGPLPATENTTDLVAGGFQSTDYSKVTPPPNRQITTIGACTVTFVTPTTPTPNPGATTPLDAGPVLNLTGPKGPKQFTAVKFGFGGFVGGGVFIDIPGFPPPTPLYLDPGSYTIDNGAGGADIGPFQATIVAPAPQFEWTNRATADSVDRSAGLDIAWTGGDPAGKVFMQGGVTLVDSAFKVTGGASFGCVADLTDGHFFVPPEVLSLLPATPAGPASGPLSTMSVGNSVTIKFDAPGSDTSLFSFQVGDVKSVVYK